MSVCKRAPIGAQEASELCSEVVALLAQWPALTLALRSGGVEVKASGIICTALESFASRSGLVVLREYQHIDFALIEPNTTPSSRLEVVTVIEAKFNYAPQRGEIMARLPAAVAQAQDYRQRVGADFAYVLYFLAAPRIEAIPSHPRDSGWGYWNGELQDGIDRLRAAAAELDVRLLAEQSAAGPQPLYCSLIECGAEGSARYLSQE